MNAYENEFIELREVNPDRDYLDHSADNPFTLRVITILSEKVGCMGNRRTYRYQSTSKSDGSRAGIF
ncbi:MAG: hypothetical protein ABFR32_13195 [Bacteroidota bacterium]